MRSLLGLLLVAALALSCAAKTLPDQTPVAASPIRMQSGEWRVVDQTFVVTDASGTMQMEETFPEAKALSRGFLRAMPEPSEPAKNPGTYQASVIGFGGKDRVVAPLASFDRARLDSTAQKIQIMGELRGHGGTTPLDKVFGEIGTALGGTSGEAAVVVFSDGLPDRPDDTLEAARQLAASHPDGVCFHGVQTGDDPAGTAFLTELSQISDCGSVSSAAQVNNPSGMDRLARTVFTGTGALPAVAAAPPSTCEGVVRLRGIEFGFDRADLAEGSAVVLDAAVEELRRCGDVRVSIDGHTDSIGTEEYNDGLSRRRAGSVGDYFVRSGLEQGRFSTRGFGESTPIAPNDSPDGRARNRRVELVPAN